MHIRTNLHYESDCILSACVCAYDRIAAHTHTHIQMLIGGRLSIAIRLFTHAFFTSSFSLLNMTATYRLQLPLLIIAYVIFSSLTIIVNAIEHGKHSVMIFFSSHYCFFQISWFENKSKNPYWT
jgi:hypothetical protein